MQYRTRSLSLSALRTHGIRWGVVPRGVAENLRHATAYAVYCGMMMNQNGWSMTRKQLRELHGLTDDQLDAALKRLTECGYVARDATDAVVDWITALPADAMQDVDPEDYAPVVGNMKDRTQRMPEKAPAAKRPAPAGWPEPRMPRRQMAARAPTDPDDPIPF